MSEISHNMSKKKAGSDCVLDSANVCQNTVDNKFDLVVLAVEVAVDTYYKSDSTGRENLINEALEKINSGSCDIQKIKKSVANRFSKDKSFNVEEDRDDTAESKAEEITFESFISEEI